LDSGSYSTEDIEDIALRDPALTIQLIAAGTSGSPRSGVALATAIETLGDSGLRLLTGELIGAAKQESTGAELLQTLRQTSLATAIAARTLALRLPRMDHSEMLLAGLTLNIGKWVLAALDPEGFASCQSGADPDGIEILDAETRVFGFHHGEAGKWYAESLHLPQGLVDTIWLHHIAPSALSPDCFPAKTIAASKLAAYVARKILSGDESTAIPDEWLALARYVELDPSELPGVMKDVSKELRRIEDTTPGPSNDPAATPSIAVQSDVERSPAAFAMLRLRVKRLETLQRALLDLHSGESLSSIVRLCAKTVREGLSVAPGVCFVTEATSQKLWGTSWRTGVDALADFSVDLRETAPGDGGPTPILRAVRELGISKIEDAWHDGQGETASRRDGLIVVPLGCGGQNYGQIIVDASETNFGVADTDIDDFMSYARGLGAIVAQWQALERAALRTEEMARSLPTNDAAKTSIEAPLEPPEPSMNDEAIRQRLNRFTGSVARTLDGPLGLISSQAQRMLANAKDFESHRALDTIVRESRRLNRFRSDLAALASHPRPRLEPSLINFRIQQFVAAMKSRLEPRGIQVEEMYAEGLPRVSLDSRRFEHVFLNLFTLAEEAMDESGGAVTIQTGATPDRKSIIIQFTHNGRGVSAKPTGDIFEPFNDHGVTTSGIALAVCRSIVEDHGGHISLDRGPEGGDTFTIVLPPATRDRASAEHESPVANATAALQTVLVVDDDDAVREILRQTLQMRGYQVLTAADGVKAQNIITHVKLDVVILDLLMPNRNGLAVLSDLSQRPDAPPVLFMTGNASPHVREEALSLGARSFLLKPFELRLLLEELDALLVPQP
jgi:signal transduction histidine kinase/CheY-like chemotaxis protein/HD-like signal output (HDOD) protein